MPKTAERDVFGDEVPDPQSVTEPDGSPDAPSPEAEGQDQPQEPADAPEDDEAEETASETEADEQAPEGEEQGKTGPIPYQQFARERKRRQELEEKYTRLDERLKFLSEKAAEPEAKQPTEELPSKDDDPFGYLDAKIQQFERWQKNQEGLSHQQQQVTQLQARVLADERQFLTQNDDYYEAVNHLRSSREAELSEMGIADPMERGRIIAQEAMQIMQAAYHAGKSPAEAAYSLAQMRGYAKPEAGEKPAKPEDKSAEAKLAKIQEGQASAKTLSGVGGGEDPSTTLEALASMSEEEFAKATEGNKWKALFS